MRIVTLLAIGTILVAAGGCGNSASGPSRGDTISRERFVEAFYELRKEGIRSPMMEISLQARDRILEDLGVTEEELITFAEAWGTDGEMMQGIWEEVDSLMKLDRMRGRGEPDVDEEPDEESGIDFRGVGRS